MENVGKKYDKDGAYSGECEKIEMAIRGSRKVDKVLEWFSKDCKRVKRRPQ